MKRFGALLLISLTGAAAFLAGYALFPRIVNVLDNSPKTTIDDILVFSGVCSAAMMAVGWAVRFSGKWMKIPEFSAFDPRIMRLTIQPVFIILMGLGVVGNLLSGVWIDAIKCAIAGLIAVFGIWSAGRKTSENKTD